MTQFAVVVVVVVVVIVAVTVTVASQSPGFVAFAKKTQGYLICSFPPLTTTLFNYKITNTEKVTRTVRSDLFKNSQL